MSRSYNKRLAQGLVLILSLCLLGLAGCGKKGLPQPDHSNRVFSWRNVHAELTPLGCIGVSGAVAGSARNVAFLELQVQPVDTSCEGCPFVAQETYRVDAATAWTSPGDASFSFAYCPAEQADAYRWRLAGHNMYTGMPPVLTPVRTVSSLLNFGEE